MIQKCFGPFFRLHSFGGRYLAVLFGLPFHFASDLAHINGGQLEAFENTVDFGRILGSYNNVRKAIPGSFVFEDTVQHTVLFRFFAEKPQFGVLYRKYLQRLLTSQHAGQTGFAFGFLLAFENGVDHHSQFFCAGAGDLRGNFNAIE